MAEETSGLPKVEGLEALLQASATDKGNEPQVTEPQQVQAPVNNDGQTNIDADLEGILKTFSTPDGKVRTKDLLKSYKEIQGYTTKTSQENAQLKENLQQLKEQLELTQYQQPRPVQPQGPIDFNQMFIDNPEQAIAAKAFEIANAQRISEVLQEEHLAKPQEFNERVGYVKMLAQNPQFAQLATNPRGVKKLFEIADKTRAANLQRNAREATKVIFGEDVDVEALKAFAKTLKNTGNTTNPQTDNLNLNAYMPPTGTSTRTGADMDTQRNDLETRKQEAIKTGDIGAVAGAVLRQALLE